MSVMPLMDFEADLVSRLFVLPKGVYLTKLTLRMEVGQDPTVEIQRLQADQHPWLVYPPETYTYSGKPIALEQLPMPEDTPK